MIGMLAALLMQPMAAGVDRPEASPAALPDGAAALASSVASPVSPAAMVALPAGTPIEFEFVKGLSSRIARQGELFPIRLSQPVTVDGLTVLPAGTPGVGEVIHAAKSGWGGKAGELLVTVRYLDVAGVHVPLRRFRRGGLGQLRTDEAMAISIIPFAGFLVSGGEIVIEPAARGNAIVAQNTALPMPPETATPNP